MKSVFTARSIPDVVDFILNLPVDGKRRLYFRGESEDHDLTACFPSIYRKDNLEREHIYLREMQRFNDHEFIADRTTFDRLARMQHHMAPTRLLDISEDILSALYFALQRNEKEDTRRLASLPVIYVFEIEESAIKFYDSDSVTVVSNLACLPLNSASNQKSKECIHNDAKRFLNNREAFNQTESVKFLLHEIRDEKPHFEPIIDPRHIFSVFCVKPKYTNRRIHGQKGALFLFGLSLDHFQKSIHLLDSRNWVPDRSPVRNVYKITLTGNITLENLERLGITMPYIYPELDKVAEYLRR